MRNPWGYSPGDSGYTDGLLHIKNDGFIPTLLDIRIIRPGALSAYYKTNLGPYTPPVFANADAYQGFLQKERISKFDIDGNLFGTRALMSNSVQQDMNFVPLHAPVIVHR